MRMLVRTQKNFRLTSHHCCPFALQVLITYTVLATTILAIISSSSVLLKVIVGPGEYDPTGACAGFVTLHRVCPARHDT